MHVFNQKRYLMYAIKISLIWFGIYCNSCNCLDCNVNPRNKESEPLVETDSGTVIGKYIKVFDTNIASFQGIPFAKPPLGNKRFALADPIDHWKATLFAQEKPPACMQYSSRKFSWIPVVINKSEDCLYLNIWTPVKCPKNVSKLSVMVWIYGGAYYSGSSSMDLYDGSVLASLGKVIVVNINYRVGSFGFFNSGNKEAPGNVGLYDQILALKWIKSNIENFGGDPESITLFGESAGSISTSLHVISPLSRDLFHRAIMQSGSAYHPHLVEDYKVSIFKANKFAEIVGCANKTVHLISKPSAVLTCLKKKDPTELAQAEDIFTSKFPYYFTPSFGASCNGCNELLPESPIKMLNSNNFSHIPILTGSNKDEATLFLSYVMPDIFVTDRKTSLTLFLAKQVITGLFALAPEISPETVFDFYFSNITEDGSDDIVKAISNSFGDYVINCPTMFFAEKTEAYVYWMTHRSLKDTSDEWMGVTHYFGVPYIFGKPIMDNRKYTLEDEKFSSDLIKRWVFFAQKGYPLSKLSNQSWPKFRGVDPLSYELNISENMRLFPRKEACEFWRPYFAHKAK